MLDQKMYVWKGKHMTPMVWASSHSRANCMSSYSWFQIAHDCLCCLVEKHLHSLIRFTAFVCLSMLTCHGRPSLNGLEARVCQSMWYLHCHEQTKLLSSPSDSIWLLMLLWHYYTWFPRLQHPAYFLCAPTFGAFMEQSEAAACIQYNVQQSGSGSV